MSQSPPLPRSHGSPNRRDRRLSIIQDSALDDLPHDTDTHALDDTSPSPHHESAMMSFMDAHAPDGQSSHKCSRPSPLMSRGNSVVAMEEVKKNVPHNNEADVVKGLLEPSVKVPRIESEAGDPRAPKTGVDLSQGLEVSKTVSPRP